MWLKGLLTVVAAALLVSAGFAGCGGSSDASGGESYEDILIGLKQAVQAGKQYDAVQRAENLDPVEEAVTDAFCETNQEMLLNEEGKKVYGTEYYISRIRLRAERELPFVSTQPVNVALGKLNKAFDLPSFSVITLARYQKACYY